METILTISGLHKQYGKVHAVNDVSFEIQKGNVYGILGPNGSGKSTTLGIVLNVVNRTSGNYSWFGGQAETHEALKKVGAIIERPNFYPYMSAYDNLKLVCKIKGVPYSKIEEKLTLVGLWERRESKFRTYSLGMKQRLAIASAILNDPEILILDEPTNGLDPQGIRQIRDLIRLIASQGTTILLASHLLDEVEKVCSHVVVMRTGKVLYKGSVAGMISSDGFLELAATDQTGLRTLLEQHSSISKVEESEGKFFVYLNTPLEAWEMNKYLVDKGIYLNHIVKRTHSLEEEFIKLTGNQN